MGVNAEGPSVTAGAIMLGIGIVHNVFAIVVGGDHIMDIVAAGGFNAVQDHQPFRMAIFWFAWSGWLMMLLGALMRWVENQGIALPGWFAIGLAAFGVSGAFFIPASGFYTILPVAWLVWSRRASGHKHNQH